MDFSDTELEELAVFLARRLSPDLKPLAAGDVSASESGREGAPDGARGGAARERWRAGEGVAAPCAGGESSSPSGDGRSGRDNLESNPPDPHPGAIDRWRERLWEARGKDRIPELLAAAASALPSDAALAEASRLVHPSAPIRSWMASGLFVVAAAAFILVTLAGFSTTGLMLALQTAPVAERPLQPSEISSLASLDRLDEIEGGETESDETEGGQAPSGSAEIEPALALSEPASAPPVEISAEQLADLPVPEAEEKSVAEATTAPLASGASREESCKRDGWVYAGRERPVGSFVVRYPVRVRAEPPRKENGWNSTTPIRCYLRKGDVVNMDQPALELPNSHFWVHVAPNTIERADGVASGDTGRR